MREGNINFKVILRIALALLPALLGLTSPALIICAYNIAFSLVFLGPGTCALASLSAVMISMLYCGMFGANGQVEGLFLGIESVLCGVACGYSLIKKKSFYFGMWGAAFGFLVPNCINLYMFASDKGQSVAEFLTSGQMGAFRTQVDSVLVQAGLESGGLDLIIDTIGKIIVMSIPSILVISSLVVGYIIMWFVCLALRKTPLRINHSFSEITPPKAVPILFIIAAASVFVLRKANELYVSAALNSAIILGSLCFFSGMSVVDYYLRRVIPSTPARVIVHFLIYIFSALFAGVSVYINIYTVYILLGIISAYADIRKRFNEDSDDTVGEGKYTV